MIVGVGNKLKIAEICPEFSTGTIDPLCGNIAYVLSESIILNSYVISSLSSNSGKLFNGMFNLLI